MFFLLRPSVTWHFLVTRIPGADWLYLQKCQDCQDCQTRQTHRAFMLAWGKGTINLSTDCMQSLLLVTILIKFTSRQGGVMASSIQSILPRAFSPSHWTMAGVTSSCMSWIFRREASEGQELHGGPPASPDSSVHAWLAEFLSPQKLTV